MPAIDVVWRLIEAYGMVIGMLLGLVVVTATVGLSLWRNEVRWTSVILGSVGMLLVAFSLWLSRDLDVSQRRTVQPRADELLTRLEYMSENVKVTLLGSTCQPKPGTAVTVRDIDALSLRAHDLPILISALRETLGYLLPSSARTKSGKNVSALLDSRFLKRETWASYGQDLSMRPAVYLAVLLLSSRRPRLMPGRLAP